MVSEGTATQEQDTAGELRRLGVVVLCLALAAGASYLAPGLERVRPWVGGEGIPIVRMFERGMREALPGFAEAAAWTAGSGGQEPQGLSGSVAAQLDDDDAAELSATEPEAPSSDRTAPPALRIKPEEYAGVEQPIENAGALEAFFRQLSRSASKQAGAVTRVAHYGDSAVAADAITSTARRKLQKRFGDSGHGFILVSRGDMHYAHKDVRHRASEDWGVYSIVQNPLKRGWYGYGGVQYRARAGAWASFETSDEGVVGGAASSFEVFYQQHRGGGLLRISVDGDKREPLRTRSDAKQDAWERVEVADGPHRLHLQVMGGGEVRLYGVAIERANPGVVYDSLGMVGARAQRLLNTPAEHIRGQIAHRRPDLLVLAFGGNEAGNKWLSLERYQQELEEVVDTMKAGRAEMSCLLFGPLDQGERDERGRVVTLEKLPEIVDVQRRVAQAKGCAFFDA
jgi:hypothetical protein